MITLFIDTSNSDVSIATIKDSILINSICKNIPNEHSVYTVSYIEEVLEKSNVLPNEVDNIMVVNGPGSFTGIRIGLTIAKTYAYLLNKEIRTVSSLKALALSIAEEYKYTLALIDAKHDNYYMGLYDKYYKEVINEGLITKEEVLNIIDKYNPYIVSNTAISNLTINVNKVNLNIKNIVYYYLNTESVNPHFITPNYLKLPQVEENNK